MSSTCAANESVPRVPVCPPASFPWTISRSGPNSSARRAPSRCCAWMMVWRPASRAARATRSGSPNDAVTIGAPASMAAVAKSKANGAHSKVTTFTAKGFEVSSRVRSISSATCCGDLPMVPRVPSAPAFETAAASSGPAPFMPAWISGIGTPNVVVNAVSSMLTSTGGISRAPDCPGHNRPQR